MRYELARDSDACAGGLRVSAIRTRSLRCVTVMVALLVFSLLCPINAYADQWSSVWHHSSLLGGEQYIVGAYNKFDAAAYICGYSKDDVQSWDLPVRYKLSTQQTAFLSLADSLEDVTPWQDDTLDSSLRNYFGDALWALMTSIHFDTDAGLGVNPFGLSIFQISYWSNNKPLDMSVWAVNTTSTDVDSAKAAIQQILNGGGSSGGGTVSDTMSFPLTNYVMNYGDVTTGSSDYLNLNSTYYYMYTNRNVVSNFPSGNVVTLTGLTGKFDFETYNNVFVFYRPSGYYSNLSMYAFKDGYILNNDTQSQVVTITPASGDDYIYMSRNRVSNNTLGISSLPFNITVSFSSVYANRGTAGVSENYGMAAAFSGDSGGGDEPTGPGDWPDDPSPEPPESPTVPTPTPPEQPTPYTPIVPPTIPPEIITNVTDPASWTDYTPWLQQILQQLRNINDEIGEHCVHIQQRIVDQATNIINALKAENEGMKDYLYELQRGLTGYLKQLFEWLADQFDFESNPYNDSSVLYWLRQIYTRLGRLIRTNAPTVLEPDPTEPFDFWAWLWGLITNVIGGFIGDFVGDVGSLIDGIKDKFPFSIPWDIAAMLALLDANRVTPVFVVNIPAVNGWWDAYSYRIDLQPFDGVASACRAMFNILWAFVLLIKTNWMLMIMGDSTSLGERFANRVGRGTE